jgi:hypothetical protein
MDRDACLLFISTLLITRTVSLKVQYVMLSSLLCDESTERFSSQSARPNG